VHYSYFKSNCLAILATMGKLCIR